MQWKTSDETPDQVILQKITKVTKRLLSARTKIPNKLCFSFNNRNTNGSSLSWLSSVKMAFENCCSPGGLALPQKAELDLQGFDFHFQRSTLASVFQFFSPSALGCQPSP
jgi:hypothetical protein